MRYTQPQSGPVQVERAHPSAKGLFAAYDFAVSTTNLVDNKPLVLGSTVVKATGQRGIGVGGNGFTAGLTFPDYSAIVAATGEATILVVLQNGTTADQGLWMIGSQSNTQASHFPYAGLVYLSDFMGVAGSRWVNGVSPVVPFNQSQVFTVQFKNGKQRAAQNGITLAANTLAQAAQFPNGSCLNLSSATASAYTYSGQEVSVFIWNRYVPDAELAALVANPWQLFKSPQRIMVASAGGASTYSYTAAGGFVLSGTTPPVRTINKTTTGGLNLSGTSPSNRGAVRTSSGGISLSGSALTLRGRVLAGLGGISFSGATSLTFTSFVQSLTVTPVGGLIIRGTATMVRTVVKAVSGGITFAGNAATTLTPDPTPTIQRHFKRGRRPRTKT